MRRRCRSSHRQSEARSSRRQVATVEENPPGSPELTGRAVCRVTDRSALRLTGTGATCPSGCGRNRTFSSPQVKRSHADCREIPNAAPICAQLTSRDRPRRGRVASGSDGVERENLRVRDARRGGKRPFCDGHHGRRVIWLIQPPSRTGRCATNSEENRDDSLWNAHERN